MNLFEMIEKRKSTRSFTDKTLEDAMLSGILEFAENAVPLTEFTKTIGPMSGRIDTGFKLLGANEAKGMFAVKAPHYIALYSKVTEGYLSNAGFIMQQIDLYLSSLGLGSCWLGQAKPAEKKLYDLEFVIVLAFGEPAESPCRDASEFKRSPINEISDGADKRIEYARLAPSAINGQPWFFICRKDGLHIFWKKLSIVKAFVLESLRHIDMGIVLCHLWLASHNFNMPFEIEIDNNCPTPPKGYNYFGTIKNALQ